MATAQQQLTAMRQLEDNWDGYGAAPPLAHVVDLADEFVALLENLLAGRRAAFPAIHVNPTRIGGVLIEWEDAAFQHEVEINPDGSFSFLHVDRSTGKMENRKLKPDELAVVQIGFLHELSQLVAA